MVAVVWLISDLISYAFAPKTIRTEAASDD